MKNVDELVNERNQLIRRHNVQVYWEMQKVRASSTKYERDEHLRKLTKLALQPMIGSEKYV